MFKVLPRRGVGKIINCVMLSAVIFGCPHAGYTQEPSRTNYSRPAGWKTVCLGRFLIDLPSSAELAATEVKYQGTYLFKGTNAVSAWGTVRYGTIKITESEVAGKDGLERTRSGVPARKTSPETYRELIEARQKDVRYIMNQMAKATSSEAAEYNDLLKIRQARLQETIRNSRVSGEAKINDVNGFAVRAGSKYVVGFVSPEDQRVRTFSGELSSSAIDSVQAAADEYQRMRHIYHPRAPTEIPSGPGFCSYYGFLDEPGKPEADVHMRVPIQIKQYPNLILALEIEPANPNGPRDIQKLPSMDVAHNALDKIGVKRTHGPKAVQILGMPGRTYAQEYSDNCSSTSCRPADQAYDMEARTFGDPAQVDRPTLLLHMTAATSDDYKLKRPAEPKGYNVPDRPALSGHVPPPFQVGQEIFDQVLRSIRVRPGAIATSQPGQAN